MVHRKSLYFICGDVKKMEQGTREQGDDSVPAMVRCLLCKHEGCVQNAIAHTKSLVQQIEPVIPALESPGWLLSQSI